MDEIMRRIEEEDRMDAAARRAQRAATASYIAEFLQQQVTCSTSARVCRCLLKGICPCATRDHGGIFTLL